MHCTIIAQQIQFIHANHSHRWKYVKCERKSPKNVAMSLTDTKWEREGKNWLITFVNQFVSISYSTLFAILPHISRNKSHDSQSDQAFNSWRCQIDCENKSDKQCYNGWISNGKVWTFLFAAVKMETWQIPAAKGHFSIIWLKVNDSFIYSHLIEITHVIDGYRFIPNDASQLSYTFRVEKRSIVSWRKKKIRGPARVIQAKKPFPFGQHTHSFIKKSLQKTENKESVMMCVWIAYGNWGKILWWMTRLAISSVRSHICKFRCCNWVSVNIDTYYLCVQPKWKLLLEHGRLKMSDCMLLAEIALFSTQFMHTKTLFLSNMHVFCPAVTFKPEALVHYNVECVLFNEKKEPSIFHVREYEMLISITTFFVCTFFVSAALRSSIHKFHRNQINSITTH